MFTWVIFTVSLISTFENKTNKLTNYYNIINEHSTLNFQKLYKNLIPLTSSSCNPFISPGSTIRNITAFSFLLWPRPRAWPPNSCRPTVWTSYAFVSPLEDQFWSPSKWILPSGGAKVWARPASGPLNGCPSPCYPRIKLIRISASLKLATRRNLKGVEDDHVCIALFIGGLCSSMTFLLKAYLSLCLASERTSNGILNETGSCFYQGSRNRAMFPAVVVVEMHLHRVCRSEKKRWICKEKIVMPLNSLLRFSNGGMLYNNIMKLASEIKILGKLYLLHWDEIKAGFIYVDRLHTLNFIKWSKQINFTQMLQTGKRQTCRLL